MFEYVCVVLNFLTLRIGVTGILPEKFGSWIRFLLNGTAFPDNNLANSSTPWSYCEQNQHNCNEVCNHEDDSYCRFSDYELGLSVLSEASSIGAAHQLPSGIWKAGPVTIAGEWCRVKYGSSEKVQWIQWYAADQTIVRSVGPRGKALERIFMRHVVSVYHERDWIVVTVSGGRTLLFKPYSANGWYAMMNNRPCACRTSEVHLVTELSPLAEFRGLVFDKIHCSIWDLKSDYVNGILDAIHESDINTLWGVLSHVIDTHHVLQYFILKFTETYSYNFTCDVKYCVSDIYFICNWFVVQLTKSFKNPISEQGSYSIERILRFEIIQRVYAVLISFCNKNVLSRMQAWTEGISCIRNLPMSTFGISQEMIPVGSIQSQIDEFSEALASLNSIPHLSSIQDKITALCDIPNGIAKGLSRFQQPPKTMYNFLICLALTCHFRGPDDILGFFAFLLSHSNQPILAELYFMEQFIPDRARVMMPGYYLTTLHAASEYLETLLRN